MTSTIDYIPTYRELCQAVAAEERGYVDAASSVWRTWWSHRAAERRFINSPW